MGSGLNKKLAKLQQGVGALERIIALESAVTKLITQNQQLVAALNQSLSVLEKRNTTIEEIVDATVTVLGVSDVQAQVDKARQEKATQQMEIEIQALEAAKAAGSIVLTETIGPKTVIVGREFEADGKVIHPGRVQLFFSQIDPAAVEALNGKTAGTTVDIPSGGKFEILEVYAVVEKAAEPDVEIPTESDASPDELEADLNALEQQKASEPGAETTGIGVSPEDESTANTAS